MRKNKVLITGVGGPAGRSASLYLREKGFYTIGTDIKETDTPVDEFFKIVPVSDPSFLLALLDIITKERPSLFIPTVQEELLYVARMRSVVRSKGCAVFVSSEDPVFIAHDKLTTVRFMEGYGISVPRTFSENDHRGDVIDQLGIPMLSKPCVGRGGRGVTVYRSRDELYDESRTGLMFQEFISGEEFDLNLFADNNSRVLSSVVLKKTALKEGIVGNALAVERASRKDIEKLGEEIVKCLKMEGPLNMDVRLREDGTPVLIEINARLGGNSLSAVEVLDSLIMAWEQETIRLHE